MIYSKLHHFKGSQKVHKGSQESVNPLCEPYNNYNILYINKLWATHDQSCEAYVNPLKYATRWYSERLAYFVNPCNNLTPTLSEGEGDKPACVSCLNNYEEEPRKHLYARFTLNDKWKMINDKAVNSSCSFSFYVLPYDKSTGEVGRGFFKASFH